MLTPTMKPATSSLILSTLAVLALAGCAHGYQSASELESAERGPSACANSCEDLKMRMSAFVLVGRDVSGCVCAPMTTAAAPAASSAPAPAPAPAATTAPAPAPAPPPAAAPTEPPPAPAPPTSSSEGTGDGAAAAAAAYVVLLQAKEQEQRAAQTNSGSNYR